MAEKKTAKKKPAAKAKDTYPEALAALLRKRKIRVPAGLLDAPPDAYARQPASAAGELDRLPDGELARQAERIAGYAQRQADRARAAWESSPLIGELRRRKLKEPAPPTRVIGAAFSLKKPLREWSDAELLEAAKEWSRRGRA